MKCAQHNEAWLLIVIAVVLLIGVGVVTTSCSGGDQSSNRPYEIFMSADVKTEDDLLELLPQYEAAGVQFEIKEHDLTIVYRYQRMIDEAIAGGDHILYQFDKKSNELSMKKIRWDMMDLPEHLPRLNVTKEQAESMVEGKVTDTLGLYFISPKSSMFSSIKPTPKNPCWLVVSVIEEYGDWRDTHVTVIDAVTGEVLGYAAPAPSANGSEEQEK